MILSAFTFCYGQSGISVYLDGYGVNATGVLLFFIAYGLVWVRM